MKPPRFCLAAALLFWGWLAGFFLPAACMALLLESAELAGVRLRITPKDLNRVADLCLLFVSGALVVLFLTPLDNDARIPLLLMQWSPMLLYPLAAAQAFAEAERFDLFALLPVLGGRRRGKERGGRARVNLLLPYFGLVLLAAGSANQRAPWYYAALFVLVGWALFAVRPARAGRWLGLLLLCGIAGYFGQHYLDILQARLRGWGGGRDPYQRETAMGSLGAVKLSDRILMRVRPGPGRKRPPLLLQEASYNFYRGTSWEAAAGFFRSVAPQNADKSDWILHPDLRPDGFVTIYRYFPRRSGMVPAPGGTTRFSDLPAREVLKNTLGAVKAERADGLCAYRAWYVRDAVFEGPPSAADLVIPPGLRPTLEQTVRESGLNRAGPQQAPALLLRYFRRHFSYSLLLSRTDSGMEPLSDFLRNTRKGHCEYFATAAAMLLREIGIPTRYVVGFAVEEYDPESGLYLVRERHGHAWTIYYLQGAWHVLDATPPSWIALESRPPDFWRRLADFRSRAVFAFARLRWLNERGMIKTGLLLTALGLGLILAFRLYRQQSIRRVGRGSRRALRQEGPPSPFALVEARLRKNGLVRPEWMPLGRWLRENACADLLPALRLHYKQRFAADSFTDRDREQLERLVADWLRRGKRKKDHLPRDAGR